MDENSSEQKVNVAEMMKERWKKMNEIAEERGHYVVDAEGKKHMIYKSQDVVDANKQAFESSAEGRQILDAHRSNLELAAKLKAQQEGSASVTNPARPAVSPATARPSEKPKSTASQKIVTFLFFLVIIVVVIGVLLINQ